MVVDIVFQRKVLILISSKLTGQFITLRPMWRPYLNNASGIIAQLKEWALHNSQNYLYTSSRPFSSFSFLSKMKPYGLCFCLHKPRLCTRTWIKVNKTWLTSCHLRDDRAENGKHHPCLFASIDIKDGKMYWYTKPDPIFQAVPLSDVKWFQAQWSLDMMFIIAKTLL